MIKVRRAALLQMKTQGIVSGHQILDSKIYEAYKQEIKDSNITYQLVPPYDHQHNITERSIQTWKNHFGSLLDGVEAIFPLHLWCQIIPQADRQLLLLSHSNANPRISSYPHVYG